MADEKVALMRARDKATGETATFFGARIVSGYNRNVPRRGTRELLEAYRYSPILQAAAKKIAYGVATTAWFAAMKTSDGEVSRMDDHLMASLLTQGTKFINGINARAVAELHLILAGEAFEVLDFNAFGKPVQKWPMPPHWVRETPTPERPFFHIVPPQGGMQVWLPMDMVIWRRDPDPEAPYERGAGIARSLVDEINVDEFAAKHMAASLANSTRPDIVISGSTDFPLDKEDRDRIETMFMERHAGPTNSGRPFFSSGPLSVDTLSPTWRDMMLTDVRAFERDIMIVAMGFSPEMLGQVETSSRASIASAEYFFTKHTLRPRLTLAKADYDTQLAPLYRQDGLSAEFDDPVEADKEFIADVMAKRPDAFTLDEWREQAGFGPMPSGAGKRVPHVYSADYRLPDPVSDRDLEAASDAEIVPEIDGEAGPLALPAPDGQQGDVQGTALSGAQIAALQALVQSVADNQLPADSAVGVILVSFPSISQTQAREMIGAADAFVPEVEPEAEPFGGKAAKIKAPTDKATEASILRAMAAIDDALFAAMLRGLLPEIVADFGEQMTLGLGIAEAFDIEAPGVVDFITESAAERSVLIGDATRRELGRSLGQGLADGEAQADLVRRVRSAVSGVTAGRARTIARTEVVRASNFGSNEAMVQAGIEQRQWLATRGGTPPRETHDGLDGDIVGINEPFTSSSGATAMYPGDFGVAAEDINCRCSIIPVIDFDEDQAKAARVFKGIESQRRQHDEALEAAAARVLDQQAAAAIAAL